MKHINICDRTIKLLSSAGSSQALTFREKLEIAKLLDKLGVDVIELSSIQSLKSDLLLIKSISAAVSHSTIAIPVTAEDNIDEILLALEEAPDYRLQVEAPVSTVCMEYLQHKKPAAMKKDIMDNLAACLELTDKVEFLALDATRSDKAFLFELLTEICALGKVKITLCDNCGEIVPVEYIDFLRETLDNVPALKKNDYGIFCSDHLHLANANAVCALGKGAGEIKAAIYPVDCIAVSEIAAIISQRGDLAGLSTGVHTSNMKRTVAMIRRICEKSSEDHNIFDAANNDPLPELALTGGDTKEAVLKAAENLGYDLSEEDAEKVYAEFCRMAAKRTSITNKELDAIVAATAMQVPPTYNFIEYMANTGNNISSVIHVKLEKDGEIKEGVAVSGGPIDACFRAIEEITERHFELDEFQIRAVTEGGSAAGETVVKLRNNGKLYSGKGISTDILCSAVKAYIIALNKILYEEEDA